MPEETNLFRAAFERSPLAQAVTNAQGLPVAWNAAFETLFEDIAGFRPARLDMPLFGFLESREAFDLVSYVSGLLEGRVESVSFESPLKARDGRRWYRVSIALATGEGAPAGRSILLCMQEVTDWKRRERTLVDAKEEAERATLTKSRFLANMSHEIRTPIQTILGMGELLSETALDEEQKEYQTQISFSAEILLALVNDILDWSKIEAGRLELDDSDFDLWRCAEQSLAMLALEAHRKGLETVLDVAPEVPRIVRGDPARLRQVIVNLAKNAVKFTEEGTVTLSVAIRVDASGRKSVRVSVADTGPGVPPGTRARLFSPFFQAGSSATTKSRGTGLGLAISRSLVEAMKGRIWHEDPGRGSVFAFEIPLREASYEVPEPVRSFDRPRRVMVVDDHEAVRAIASRMIASFGAECDVCAGGEQAIALARARAASGGPLPDIVLVDQGMRGMDGWRFASELKDLDLAPALVLMIPEGLREREAKMKRLGWFHGYVAKPLREDLLYDALTQALAVRESGLVAMEGDRGRGTGGQGKPPTEAGAIQETASDAAAPRGGPPAAAKRVLVAEDHDVNRELFSLFLSRLGYDAELVTDGEQAVEKAREGRWDAVLLDLFMPKKDGLDAAREMREAGVSVPVIAVTASVQKEDRDRCLAAGMNDVLRKPFKLADLDAMLAYWLSRRPQDEAPRATPGAEREKHLWERDVFDFGEALETFLGNRDTLTGLVSRFRERTAEQVALARAALDANDMAGLRALAHAIKGSAWNLSAKRLGDAALALEDSAKAEDATVAIEALEALAGAFSEFSECSRYYEELFY